MSYTINLTNGAIFATIPDGTINTSSSMVLVGKNYAGYGEFLDENFVHLLENSSNSTAPTAPLKGQLWWDSSNNLLKVYNGSQFKVISAATASGTAPTSNVAGDLWYDSTNSLLKVYTGTGWLTVGPSSVNGTGATPVVVSDTLSVSHNIIELTVGNAVVGIVSADAAFTPSPSIAGFATVRPGFQLSTQGGAYFFQGTATESQTLAGLTSSQFMRTDTSTSTSGSIAVTGNVSVGSGLINAAGNGISNIGGAGAYFGTVHAASYRGDGSQLTGVVTPGAPASSLSVTGNTTLANLTILASKIIDAGLNQITNVATPTMGTDAATKAYVDIAASGAITIRDDSANTTSLSTTDGNLSLLGTANEVTVAITGQDQVTFGLPDNVTVAGNLLINNDATIAGNLTVNGTTTTINSNAISTNDKAITLGNNQSTGTALDGAGIDVGSNNLATWRFSNSGNAWVSNIGVSAVGNISGNYILGNGALLSGISAGSGSRISNGTSQANIGTTNGDIVFTVAGANIVTVSAAGIVNNQANGVGNIGSPTGYFNTIHARATSAQYADVAERFAADADYDAGTVVELGGSAEITKVGVDLSDKVFGVISTRAAYLMNAAAGTDNTHPPVAMTGRVPVKVLGQVNKGDRLVSAGNGVARAAAAGEASAFNTIGRALANKLDAGLGTVEAIVTIK